MTRWARANNVHKHKPADATPWSQLRGGGRGGPLRKTQADSSSVKKPNRKKKEYVSEDVNGFLEYLQQSGQMLPPPPPPPPGGEQEGGRELREEVEEVLKKDRRREERRVKRQKNKKIRMVSL